MMTDFRVRNATMNYREWNHFEQAEYFRLNTATRGCFEQACLLELAKHPAQHYVRVLADERTTQLSKQPKVSILYEGPVRKCLDANMLHLLVLERTQYSGPAWLSRGKTQLPEDAGIVGIITTDPKGRLCVVDCRRLERNTTAQSASLVYPEEIKAPVVLEISTERYGSRLIAPENGFDRVIIQQTKKEEIHPPTLIERAKGTISVIRELLT